MKLELQLFGEPFQNLLDINHQQQDRRVINTTATGSTESHRVRLNLTLEVSRVHFSPAASSSNAAAGGISAPQGTAMLQIAGKCTSENPYVKMGAFHTLDIETNRDIRIIKAEWDSISLDRVTEACVEGRGAEVGAIVCGEGIFYPPKDPHIKYTHC